MSPGTYKLLWIVLLSVFALFWLAGSLSMPAVVVFGFIAFGMVFMGMMCVLPAAVGPHAADVRSSEPGVLRLFGRRVARATIALLNRWFVPVGVEIRRPRFH